MLFCRSISYKCLHKIFSKLSARDFPSTAGGLSFCSVDIVVRFPNDGAAVADDGLVVIAVLAAVSHLDQSLFYYFTNTEYKYVYIFQYIFVCYLFYCRCYCCSFYALLLCIERDIYFCCSLLAVCCLLFCDSLLFAMSKYTRASEFVLGVLCVES